VRRMVILAGLLVTGCVSDGGQGPASPDVHDMSLFGNYAAALSAQAETDRRVIGDTAEAATTCTGTRHPYALVPGC
jgi:hypothetical protein